MMLNPDLPARRRLPIRGSLCAALLLLTLAPLALGQPAVGPASDPAGQTAQEPSQPDTAANAPTDEAGEGGDAVAAPGNETPAAEPGRTDADSRDPASSADPAEPADPAPPAEPAEPADPHASGTFGTESFESFVASLDIRALWLGNGYERWGILFIAIFVGLVLGKFVSFVLCKAADKLTRRKFLAELLTAASGPSNLLLITMGVSAGLMQLRMSDALAHFFQDVLKLLGSIAVFWFLYNLIAVVELLLRRLTRRTHSDLDDQIVPLIRKTMRIFLVIIAVLFIAENVFGANIGAWLAGLGIAGLAVSLAAQDSIKNLFGSITILFDRPFKVGDFINFGGKSGTVDEIGFRSTRMRLLNGSLLTIPNNSIINDTVENIGVRPWIRRDVKLTLPGETAAEQLREALAIVHEILAQDGIRENLINEADPDDSPPRAYFADFNNGNYDLLIFYWHRPPAYWDYMDHAQRFNLEITRRFAEAGIRLAFPTQTVHLEGAPENPQARPDADVPGQ